RMRCGAYPSSAGTRLRACLYPLDERCRPSSGPRESCRDPAWAWRINKTGTPSVCQAEKEAGARRGAVSVARGICGPRKKYPLLLMAVHTARGTRAAVTSGSSGADSHNRLGPVRRVIREVGLALITLGIITLLFVGYQLWGTGLAEAHSQSALKRDF